MTSSPDPQPPTGNRPPAPLVVAASLVVVEAVLIAVQGLVEIFVLSADRLVMGVTTTAFFLGYAVALAWCAWGLMRLKSWARAPVVVAQLIQLLVAWSFWGGQTSVVALGLAVTGVLVLVGLFHPASITALADEPAGS